MTIKARQDKDLEALDLDGDAERVLNPIWQDAFLAFFEMSHLPPERIHEWARALLAVYPADPSQVERRYPLTIEAISRWQSKMYGENQAERRRQCIELFDEPETLVCCLATTPIVLPLPRGVKVLGTLIIAFERRSETLFHHIVRHEATAMEVLSVAQKLVTAAAKRLDPRLYIETKRYLVMPAGHIQGDWSNQLRWLFEKNLPRSARAPATDVDDEKPRCHADATLDGNSKSLQCHVQGQRFFTRHDLWVPIDYAGDFPFPSVECTHDKGDNDVHDLLAKAARSVREEMRRQAKKERRETVHPTWEGHSRARR